jgi:NitT/TauT family transport system permease protein
MAGRGHKALALLVPLATFAAIVAAWQLVVWLFRVPTFLLPGPIEVWNVAVAFGGNWTRHIGTTVRGTLAGFGLAIVVGISLAVVIVHSQALSRILTPVIVLAQIVPKIAFAPLILIWFGIGPTAIVVVTFLVAFFPVVVNSSLGLAEVDPDLMDLMRILRLSRWRILWTIRFPAALPHIFSGLKVASTLAVIGAIIGEFVGSNSGLGYLVIIANNNMNTPLALASIVVISVFGLLLYGTISALEMMSMPWKPVEITAEPRL